MNNEIKVNKANKSITFVNNGIAFSQFGVADEILDLITNLQQRCEYLERSNNRREDEIMSLRDECVDGETYKSRNEKAIEYITSYEAISTIQGLDKIEQNKKLDEKTMNVMVERYLKVHHNLLNILQGDDKSE